MTLGHPKEHSTLWRVAQNLPTARHAPLDPCDLPATMVLWLMEHRPRELATFLREAEPNREQLRLVAQALAGPALKGGELADVSPTGEMAALAKLTSNWRSVIEDNATTVEERADQKHGQKKLFE